MPSSCGERFLEQVSDAICLSCAQKLQTQLNISSNLLLPYGRDVSVDQAVIHSAWQPCVFKNNRFAAVGAQLEIYW